MVLTLPMLHAGCPLFHQLCYPKGVYAVRCLHSHIRMQCSQSVTLSLQNAPGAIANWIVDRTRIQLRVSMQDTARLRRGSSTAQLFLWLGVPQLSVGICDSLGVLYCSAIDSVIWCGLLRILLCGLQIPVSLW